MRLSVVGALAASPTSAFEFPALMALPNQTKRGSDSHAAIHEDACEPREPVAKNRALIIVSVEVKTLSALNQATRRAATLARRCASPCFLARAQIREITLMVLGPVSWL